MPEILCARFSKIFQNVECTENSNHSLLSPSRWPERTVPPLHEALLQPVNRATMNLDHELATMKQILLENPFYTVHEFYNWKES
jgi:hypothetical protein